MQKFNRVDRQIMNSIPRQHAVKLVQNLRIFLLEISSGFDMLHMVESSFRGKQATVAITQDYLSKGVKRLELVLIPGFSRTGTRVFREFM